MSAMTNKKTIEHPLIKEELFSYLKPCIYDTWVVSVENYKIENNCNSRLEVRLIDYDGTYIEFVTKNKIYAEYLFKLVKLVKDLIEVQLAVTTLENNKLINFMLSKEDDFVKHGEIITELKLLNIETKRDNRKQLNYVYINSEPVIESKYYEISSIFSRIDDFHNCLAYLILLINISKRMRFISNTN